MSTGIGQPGSIDALARYFEYWLLKLEGVYPAIDRCAHCDRPLDDGAVLDEREQAFVCRACGHSGPAISRDALGFLRGLATRRPDDVAASAPSPAALVELERAHRRLIAGHLDKDVRSARVLSELRPRV